jgi:hypothetical protein
MNRFHHYHYLLSTLPALEPIGSIPPMSKRDLLEQVVGSNGPVETVKMFLLGDDLTQYEALTAKEIEPGQADMVVLSIEMGQNGPVLPDFLVPEERTEEQDNRRLSVDEMWSRYFHHAIWFAKQTHSHFLRDWVGFETGLRNALVTARSQALELDFTTYLVAPDLADKDMDYSAMISAWSAASNPLAALEVLDKARWDWLEEHGSWYSFYAAEIEVYTAKLILLHHWRRILSEKQKRTKTTAA